MGYQISGSRDLILHGHEVTGFHGRAGQIRLLTAEEVRQLLGYGHLRHVYWLVEQGHLPYRKFGRELVFTVEDVEQFRAQRGY